MAGGRALEFDTGRQCYFKYFAYWTPFDPHNRYCETGR